MLGVAFLCGVTFFGQQAHPIHTRWRTQGCEGVTWHVAVTVVWRAPGTNNMLRVRMCGEKYLKNPTYMIWCF